MCTGAASSGTVSQTMRFEGAGPGTRVLAFDPFDPSLGSLVQVLATLTARAEYPGVSLFSTVQDARDTRLPEFEAAARLELSVDFTGTDLTLSAQASVGGSCDRPPLGDTGFFQPCEADIPEWVATPIDVVTLGGARRSDFVASAPAAGPRIAVVSAATSHVDGRGREIERPDGPFWSASGSVRLDYIYLEPETPGPPGTPDPPAVPLPGGLPLLVAGLGGLAVAGRHRRA